MGKTIKASEFKCKCGKQAEVFVGLSDIDAEHQTPLCRKCADEWKMKLMIKLSEMDDFNLKNNEKEN